MLHWGFNHFVVFERTTRAGIRVVDPAHGRRVVSGADLRRAYTGVAILLEPSEVFDRGGSRAKGTWRYLRPMLGQSGNMVRVIATSLVIRLAALGLPLLTALVVDEIVPRDDHRLLLVFTAGVAVVIGYNFLSSFLRANVLLELQTRLDTGLTLGFVDHLVKLPYDFFLRRSAGDLMMRLQSNTAVRDILATSTLSAVLDGTFASLYLVLLFVISPDLAIVVLLLALGQVATLLLSWRRNQRLMSGSLQAQADTQSYAYEMLAGIETLKASGAEHRAADRWGDLFTDQVNIDLTRGRLNAAVGSVMGTLQVAAPLVILLTGTFQVLDGHLSLGTMLSAAALGAGFLNPLASLVASGLQLQQLASYMHRINDVLDTPREQHGTRVRPAPRLSGRIRAQDVSFRYGTLGPAVVSQVSLEIRPGQHVGIVGRSGSGSRPWRTCCSACTGRRPAGSSSTAGTWRACRPDRSAARSASSPSTPTCSAPRSGTTSPSPTPNCRSTRSPRRPGSRASTRTSPRCRWATTPSCTTAVPRFPGDNVSASRSPARWSTSPRSCSSTRPPVSSTR